MIEFIEVNKKLGNNAVLENLNLKIKNKTVFGLVGVNGAGKSTLLRCLSGVYKIDAGAVKVENEDVYENVQLKKQIFLVSDDSYYPINATINSLKAFYKTFYTIDESKFNQYLEVLKLDPKKPINNFSKGMKRQTFLLFALAMDIKILILDEAFDGLDPFVRLIFKKAIADLIEEKDMVIIISSHNLRELEDVCDTFGILENHRIVTSGDLDISKENIHKIQVVFNNDVILEELKDIEILQYNKVGRVITVVCKGDIKNITAFINRKNPLLLEVLPINFEELFIYELEGMK